MLRIITLLIVFLCSLHIDARSQTTKAWVYEQQVQIDSLTFVDTISIEVQLNDYLLQLQSEGYLEANIDSVFKNEKQYHIYIHKGETYTWVNVLLDSLPREIIPGLPSFIEFKERSFNIKQLQALYKELLQYADEIGYPFAKIQLKDIHISNNNKIAARLYMDLGMAPTIDSIHIYSNTNISKRFLLQYLDLFEGMPYNAKKLNNINRLLQSLPYVEIEKDWSLEMGFNERALKLYLKEKKANQINAIVGLQPSNIEDKSYDLTADVMLHLHNPFGFGEQFKMTYQQLQAKSPRFHVSATWPYLLGTPFGISGSFDLLQQDTTFRRTTGNIGIIYQLNAMDHLKLYYEHQSSRAIVFDTNFIKINKRLPPNIDIQSSGVGIGLQINRLNNNLNPRSGILLQINAVGGSRKVLKNNAIYNISDADTFNYDLLYDTMSINKLQARIRSSIHYYLPIATTMTLKLGYEQGWISGNQLFRNELYQLGGFKQLRGFNEWSIHSPHFHQVIVEPRLLMNRTSHLFIFSDIAYIEQINLLNIRKFDWAYSFGIGGSLDSPTGVFNVALAVGKIGNEQLQFRNMRIHFGYAIYF